MTGSGAAQTPYVSDVDFTLYVGDVREVLKTLPDESVQCVVTSPPYWGLRDYGNEGQLGLEPTPEAYVAAMTDVFREVRRVLRRDGTCWLNIGDSYVSDPGKGGSGPGAKQGAHVNYGRERMAQVKDGKAVHDNILRPYAVNGLAPKNLVGIPWRLAFALQADGWYLRSEIIWAKPNPMPESVTDRPTKSHEQVFLLTRSARYYFDQEAVREPYGEPGREWWNETATAPGNPDRKDGGGIQSRPGRGPDGRRKTGVLAGDGSIQHRDGERWPNLAGRNLRSVWEIPTEPFPEAHFATYPQALVERCVKAGTKPGDVVLDPFLGSGTTALVARRLGRRSVGIELNEAYAEMAARRLGQQSLLAELVS